MFSDTFVNRITTFLSLRDSKLLSTKERHTDDSLRDCTKRTAHSRQIAILQQKLGSDITRPMGPRLNPEFQNSVQRTTDSGQSPQSIVLHSNRTNSVGGRDPEFVGKESYRENSMGTTAVCLQHVPSGKEGWRSETSNQSETTELLCEYGTFQDGRDSLPTQPAKVRRLDGKNRFERRIFYDPNTGTGQSLPDLQVQRPIIPIQMSTIRPIMCPMGLHQDPKTSRGPAETARDTTSCLYRRHPDNGGVQRAGPGKRDRSGFLVREPGFCDKQRQEHSRTNTRNRISGIQCKLSEYGIEPSIKEDKTNQIRYKTIMQQCSNNSQETVSIAGTTAGSNKSDSPCSIILPSATEKADHNIGQIQSQLRSSPDFRERRVGGTRMVAEPHVILERQNTDGRETIADNRVRCLKKGLGSDLRGEQDRWSVVKQRVTVPYQYTGSSGSFPCNQMLCQRQESNHNSSQDRQCGSGHISSRTVVLDM